MTTAVRVISGSLGREREEQFVTWLCSGECEHELLHGRASEQESLELVAYLNMLKEWRSQDLLTVQTAGGGNSTFNRCLVATFKMLCSSTDGKLHMCTFALWKSWFTQIQVRSLLLLQTTFPPDIQNNFCHVSRIVTEFSASDHTTFLWVQQWHYCAQKTLLNNESTHALCVNTLYINIQKCSIKTQH